MDHRFWKTHLDRIGLLYVQPQKGITNLVIRHFHIYHGGTEVLQQDATDGARGILLVLTHQGEHLFNLLEIER